MAEHTTETREVTVEMDASHRSWLRTTADEYGLPVEDVARELLKYGLVHHEDVMGP